jgi:cytochrome d ubiquinol oxidase subunit I
LPSAYAACGFAIGSVFTHRAFQWFALAMGPAGLLALLAGWMTTEAGRQPWVIYGLLRTRDAVSLHSTRK